MFAAGCLQQEESVEKEPPAEIPRGILVDEIPQGADIIFTSIRYILSDLDCLDDNYDLKDNFITDPDCNYKIYTSGKLATPRQLFTMDLETEQVIQLTNNDCFFITSQVVNSTTIMALAACFDTDSNGLINEDDELELYLLDLATETMDCLTDELDLAAINNPDYSPINGKIVFSAQQNGAPYNYIFTINVDKELLQITDDDDYVDFDCAWSEDGSKIVFNRLPLPAFTKPSQVWLMNSDGTGAEKITDGGPNPDNEDNPGSYTIGTDADPDLSPDNSQVVFSRLKTLKQNALFGVWELVVVDVVTKEETVLASQYANMVPEWKSEGILYIKQQAVENYISHPMDIKQSLYEYKDGQFTEMENYPYNVFPIGAWGGSWIE